MSGPYDPLAFAGEVLAALPYEPNQQQIAVVAALARHVDPAPRPDGVFILNGYAGTGKTSLTGALVRTLEAQGREVVLLAPTGRAAKVFSANSGGHRAYTIHRRIYRHVVAAPGQYTPPAPADNRSRDAVFIVDEASMISGDSGDNPGILDDLLSYVFAGDNSRLILIGDTAQLPPVGREDSPAMLAHTYTPYGLRVSRATLTATARQAVDSGILFNATRLRRALLTAERDPAAAPVPRLRTAGFDDVRIVEGEDLPEILSQCYDSADGGAADTILITRSNRRACEYNAAIRANILYREEELTRGDMLIVARNHYFAKRRKDIDFVANGDIVTVERIIGTETRYGMRFADVLLSLPVPAADGDDTADMTVTFEAKILLSTLSDPSATMSRQTWDALYYGVMTDNERYGDMDMDSRTRALRTDPYWTALVVKYAYAVTCHKAQGGQWHNVFVDLSYIPDDALGPGLYRWFYTAVTRARTRLYLITPPPALIEE